jgi:hypothetical protein
MQARIFKPAKTAMQSGRANTEKWVLEFAPSARREADPLMGWTSSDDTRRQLSLRFSTREEAVAYAEREGIPFVLVEEPQQRKPQPKAYADNFRFDRLSNWTH